MARPNERTTEELVVGIYAAVAAICVAVFAGVQLTTRSHIGGAFLVIGAFWLCVVAAVAAAIVVLVVNVDRRRRDESSDRWASGFAALILIALTVSLYLAFAADRLQVAMAVGAVGLVVAPLGLLAVVFEDRLVGGANKAEH